MPSFSLSPLLHMYMGKDRGSATIAQAGRNAGASSKYMQAGKKGGAGCETGAGTKRDSIEPPPVFLSSYLEKQCGSSIPLAPLLRTERKDDYVLGVGQCGRFLDTC